MSISKNVGGISLFLSKARTRKVYKKSSGYIKKAIQKLPRVSNRIINGIRRVKYSIKQLFLPNMLFEDLGFKYFGPIDGHNIEKLENIFRLTKGVEGPILIHVVTKKGKGYMPAEENPDKFHSASNFDIETGESKKKKQKDYSKVFGDKLVSLAEENKDIVAITAAMTDGTGLTEFAKKFPNRFFDVGIAEQHAVGLAAGMAKSGLIPVVPLYSSFIQRAYDQLVHDVAIQNLPVVICADRAGIVGNDGETHQGLLDMAFTNTIPNFNIMAPKDFCELENMLDFAINLNKPVLIRYPRGTEQISFEKCDEIKYGKAEVLEEGKDIVIIAIGKMVSKAIQVSDELKKSGIIPTVINARFLKPFDNDTILKNVVGAKKVITIEDGTVIGGLGDLVEHLLFENKIDVEFEKFAYPDEFVKHGSVDEIEEKYGLDVGSIVRCLKNQEKNIKIMKTNY